MNYDHKFNDQSKIRPCVEISPELTGIYHDSVCVESTLWIPTNQYRMRVKLMHGECPTSLEIL